MPDELILRFRRKDIACRTVDELIGLARGLVADGVVNEQEAEYLSRWLGRNARLCDSVVVRMLNDRVCAMLEDGVFDAQERKELFEILSELAGQEMVPDGCVSMPTTLPLDQPQPDILFDSQAFCFTGKFAFGPRRACAREVEQRGGLVLPGITKQLDILVIGSVGSEAWKHSSFGRKIEKAVEYRDERGVALSIVSEDHWASHLL